MELEDFPTLRDHPGRTSYFADPLTDAHIEALTVGEEGQRWAAHSRLTTAWMPSSYRGSSDLTKGGQRASMLLHRHGVPLLLRPGEKDRTAGATAFILDKRKARQAQTVALGELIASSRNKDLRKLAFPILMRSSVAADTDVGTLMDVGITAEEIMRYQETLARVAGPDLLMVRLFTRGDLARAILMPEGTPHYRWVPSRAAFDEDGQLEVLGINTLTP